MLSNLTVFNGWKLQKISASQQFGQDQRREARARQSYNAQLELLNQIEHEIPGAKYGHPNLIIANQTIDALLDFIDEYQDEGRVQAQLRRFLRRGLLAGKARLNWHVAVPPSEVVVQSEKNPITPVIFKNLPILRRQTAAFESVLCAKQHVKQPIQNMFYYGQLIFSSTLFGGLTDTAAWLQLPYAKEKILHYQDYAWVDLFTDSYPKHTSAKRGIRRWFIDPVSLILLTRLPCLPERLKDRDSLRRWLYSALQHYLNQLDQGINQTHHDTTQTLSVSQWIAIVHNHSDLILSPYQARYCRAEVTSSAWHHDTWLRILKQQRPLKKKSDNTIIQNPLNTIGSTGTIDVKSLSFSMPDSTSIFKKIRKSLHRKQGEPEPTFKEVGDRLKSLLPVVKNNSALLYCLLIWIYQRFKNKEIRRSTAYQQLTSIGRDLLSAFDDSELLNLEAEEFQQGYESILENTRSGITRNNKAALLVRFHKFMSENIGVASIDMRLGEEGFFATPDANFLGESEYEYIYKFLLAKKILGPIEHAQLIALMLGYRCGLRISEVQNIKLKDIQYLHMLAPIAPEQLAEQKVLAATLLVRSNQYNRLKSQTSKRQLPLNELLAENELIELLSYHQHQLNKQGVSAKSAYLSSLDSKNLQPMDIEPVKSGLHALMRAITGDNTITFHHLRHSFACNWLQSIYGLDRPLVPIRHLRNNMPKRRTRKHIHQLASYMGHSSAAVTLEHYAHNLDILLRQAMWPHTFDHKKTGHGTITRYLIKYDLAKCVNQLINMTPENQRWHNNKYGSIMAWLPKKLKIKPALQDHEWMPYRTVELKSAEPVNPRTLTDLCFEEWCALLTALRNGATTDIVINTHYLDIELAIYQLDCLAKTLTVKTRHNNSRITSVSKKAKKPYSYLIKPPRSKAELKIAKHIFERCVRLINSISDENKTLATNGLNYFFENYRYWENTTIARYSKRHEQSFKKFSALLAKVIPREVTVVTARNDADSRQYMIGSVELKTKSKQAQYGPAFGLLLAYVYGVLA